MSTLVTHLRKVSRKKLLFFWILSKLLTHSFMPLRLDWCDFDMFKTITQNLLMLLLLVMLTFKIMLTIAWLQLTAWQQLARFGKSSTPAFQHLSTVLIFLSTLGTSLSKLVSLFFCVVTMSRALNPWVLCAFYNASSLTYSCQSSFLLECPLSGHFAHDSARWFPQFTVFTEQKVKSIVCVWGEEREKEKEKKNNLNAHPGAVPLVRLQLFLEAELAHFLLLDFLSFQLRLLYFLVALLLQFHHRRHFHNRFRFPFGVLSLKHQ